MNEILLDSYLTRLKAALGDDEAFMPIFEELKADTAIKQPEAVALASRFAFKIAPSTSKSKALEWIRRTHKDQYIFILKERAMRGRSAA